MEKIDGMSDELQSLLNELPDEEKQYWIDVLPNMNIRKIERLINILETQKKKFEELNKQFYN